MAVRGLPPYLVGREITIFISNQAAILVINRPKQQLGQHSITQIYETVRKLKEGRNRILLRWVPAHDEFQLGRDAKKAARRATEVGRLPQKRFYSAKATVINTAKAERQKHRTLLDGAGKHLKNIHAAIPGRHTRKLYDAFGRKEACLLAQLRTGMARLNGYLHHIGVVDAEIRSRLPLGTLSPNRKGTLQGNLKFEVKEDEFYCELQSARGSISRYIK
jgi:hypothetical protein